MFKQVKFLLLLVGIVSVLFSGVRFYDVLNEEREKNSQALAAVESLVAKQTRSLSKTLRKIEPVVATLANDLHEGRVTVDHLEHRLQQDLGANEDLFGLGLAFEPYAASADTRLWSRMFVSEGSIKAQPIDYDYTQFEYDWYRKPLLLGKYWNEPYIGEASKTFTAEYGEPFWLPGKDLLRDDPDGIIFASISIATLKNLINYDHELISYYQILSRQGQFIVHPDQARVLSGETVFEEAWEREDPILNSMAVHAVKGESGHISHVDPVSNTQSWIIYQPIEGLDMSMVVVVDKARLIVQDDIRRQWFSVLLYMVLSLVLIALFCSLQWSGPSGRNVLPVSIFMSLIIFVGVYGLWKVADSYPLAVNSDELKIYSSNVLSDFKNKQVTSARELSLSPPKFIETGVYLQSVEFEGANNVKISAYVWQHYKKGLHKGLARGFVLPEAHTPTIEEVHRSISNPDDPACNTKVKALRDCDEVIRWYVTGSLRQAFDYSLYPLDSQQVWLRMWHDSYQDNVVLVPDIGAYVMFNPKGLPGVQEGFVLPGWQIEEAWFSIQEQLFTTNFGDRSLHGIQRKPELFYNISIEREFLNPFVSRIIPAAVISIMMFLIVLISTKTGEAASWLGFTANDVVVGLSALFFVIGLTHTDLRQSLNSSSIMYFEYLYFVIYIMLLYVAITSVLIAKRDLIDGYDENFLTKNLFWPVLSIAIFAVTFGVFY